MNLSTALIIPLFIYGIFMVLLAIEYFTDKLRKHKVPPRPPRKTPEPTKKEDKSSTEQLEDLEARTEEEAPTGTEAPVIWKNEDFE